MKKAGKKYLLVGLLIVVTTSMLTGCFNSNQSGATVDEPDITLEYLKGEYANQLIRDEAEYVFGCIDLTVAEDGSVLVDIDAKEYVNGDADVQLEEAYIEDKNMTVSTVLSTEARCTFLQGKTTLPQIMTAEEFVEAYNKDMAKNGGENNLNYGDSKYYDIYIMGGQIELILARYIP